MAAAANTGGGGGQVVLTPNTSPQNITFKQSVVLSTQDLNNNNAPVSESYVVSGPDSPAVTPIFLAGGTKAVIPLTNQSGNGAPYLKIWFPTNGNTLYLTYCVANQYMMDGFYDYTTGVPTTYFNALRAWINTNPSTGQPYPNSAYTRTRSLKFSAYGAATNKPANSVTFYINFNGIFNNISGVLVSGTGTVGTGGITFGGG